MRLLAAETLDKGDSVGDRLAGLFVGAADGRDGAGEGVRDGGGMREA